MSVRSLIFAAAALAAVAGASPALAQNTASRQIVTSQAARKIVDACLAVAAKQNAKIAVAVVDPYGNLLDYHTMQGASVLAGTTAILKAKTAARWRRSTAAVNRRLLTGVNRAPQWLGDFPQPGALPILVDGQTAGAVGVGGGQNDEACARAGITAVFGANAAPPPMPPAK